MKVVSKRVAIYHNVYAHENFEESANTLFSLIKKAQQTNPKRERVLYLEIEGHRNSKGGFDNDMFELQRDFILGLLMPYLSEARMPLCSVKNNKVQINSIPDVLNIMTNIN